MHEMHYNFSKSCMAWQNARNKLSQNKTNNSKIILRQNILTWKFSKFTKSHKNMATRINPIKLDSTTHKIF